MEPSLDLPLYEDHSSQFIQGDCRVALAHFVADESVDLVITDPPYGISGDKLHEHYNRDERFVVDGYIEVPQQEYAAFTHEWVAQIERILKPGGQVYIVSGYTNLYYLLDSLRSVALREVNHIIWKYNFGVFTTRKFVSSHYHILYYAKPGGRRTFETESRFGLDERDADGSSLNYADREDVWTISREYKPGRVKNKNELPTALLMKMLQYSSNRGDVVCDPFMGGFSTARVAIGLDRRFVGCEASKPIYEAGLEKIRVIRVGDLLATTRMPQKQRKGQRGASWSESDITGLRRRYHALLDEGLTKAQVLEQLMREYDRGKFGIKKALKKASTIADAASTPQLELLESAGS